MRRFLLSSSAFAALLLAAFPQAALSRDKVTNGSCQSASAHSCPGVAGKAGPGSERRDTSARPALPEAGPGPQDETAQGGGTSGGSGSQTGGSSTGSGDAASGSGEADAGNASQDQGGQNTSGSGVNNTAPGDGGGDFVADEGGGPFIGGTDGTLTHIDPPTGPDPKAPTDSGPISGPVPGGGQTTDPKQPGGGFLGGSVPQP
jgi:hypothetical protein